MQRRSHFTGTFLQLRKLTPCGGDLARITLAVLLDAALIRHDRGRDVTDFCVRCADLAERSGAVRTQLQRILVNEGVV